MNTRTATILVLVTAAILAAGFLVVFGLGRGLQAFQRAAATEGARQAFVARWRPPATLSPEAVFPSRIQGRTPSAPETNPRLTDPALDLPGLRAVYEAPGFLPIEVFVCQPRPMEADAIRQRTRDAFSARPGSTSVSQVNDRLCLSSTSPPQSVEIWDLQGWLFFFRSPAGIPIDFIRDYLTALAIPKARDAAPIEPAAPAKP